MICTRYTKQVTEITHFWWTFNPIGKKSSYEVDSIQCDLEEEMVVTESSNFGYLQI